MLISRNNLKAFLKNHRVITAVLWLHHMHNVKAAFIAHSMLEFHSLLLAPWEFYPRNTDIESAPARVQTAQVQLDTH